MTKQFAERAHNKDLLLRLWRIEACVIELISGILQLFGLGFIIIIKWGARQIQDECLEKLYR